MSTPKNSRTQQGRGQAATRTVAVAAEAMQTIIDRGEGVPGMAVLSGRPGLGKTTAAVFLSHPGGYGSAYVSCRSFETTKSLALMLLHELGVAAKTHWPISTMFDRICDALVEGDRPLVVDEVDKIAEARSIELLRDLHDTAKVPVFLIGEENLKQKLLNHHERFHDRVLVWAKAMPADKRDLAALLEHYAPGLPITAEALGALLKGTDGTARKIVTALDALKNQVAVAALEAIEPDHVAAALRGVR